MGIGSPARHLGNVRYAKVTKTVPLVVPLEKGPFPRAESGLAATFLVPSSIEKARNHGL